MSVAYIISSILGLAFLMIVHESGHLFAARAFGLRVTTFSIGFGPSLFRVEPADGYFWFTALGGKIRLRLGKHDEEKHGPTVYQVALIPFLAYVQIAGMNPFEDNDPEDKGSYANASLIGRISTIFAGPLANYVFASVLFFVSFFYGGVYEPTMEVTPLEGKPAAAAGVLAGDEVVMVNGARVDKWNAMAKIISTHPGKEIVLTVKRDGAEIPLKLVPEDKEGKGLIGIGMRPRKRAVSAGEAGKLALIKPTLVVKGLVGAFADLFSGRGGDLELAGPVRIVKEGAAAAKRSIFELLGFMGVLSAYLGIFNLVPFPALDGGRLVFLGYELTTRKRPNAELEAHIHVVGLMMLLGLTLYVVIFKDLGAGQPK